MKPTRTPKSRKKARTLLRWIMLTVVMSSLTTAVVILHPLQLIGKLQWFPVKELIFSGGSHIELKSIEERCGPIKGHDIFALSLGKLRACIKEFGWARNALLSRKFPATVVIAIEEELATAIGWTHDGWSFLNEDGRVLGPAEGRDAMRLPLIPQFESLAENLRLQALRLATLTSSWVSPTSRQTVMSDILWDAKKGWILHLVRGVTVYVGDTVSEENLDRLNWLLQKDENRLMNSSIIDLRLDKKVIVKTAS